jgi:uncharacterized protein (DUF697 family)
MNAFENAQDEFAGDVGEYEDESFEFEDDHESGQQFGSPLNQVEEMELAAELLNVSGEEELDQFLGKLFKRAWGGIKKVAAGPLGGILKGIAKKALPFVGGALGSFIPIPGVGTALGTALGGAASNLLEVDLEGMGPEEQEFEMARRFVRFASSAAEEAANAPLGLSPNAAAVAAVRNAISQLSGQQMQSRRHRKRSGRWLRQGEQIVLLGA